MLESQRTGFVAELIAWATRTCSLWIAALSHKAANYAMKCRIIVKALTRQEYKIVHGNGCLGRKQLNSNVALCGMKDRRVLLFWVDLQCGRFSILFCHTIPPG